MSKWVINKWYRTRGGEVVQCVETDAPPHWWMQHQPFEVRAGRPVMYWTSHCVGGEFYGPGVESCYDIVAGPFDTEAEAAGAGRPKDRAE